MTTLILLSIGNVFRYMIYSYPEHRTITMSRGKAVGLSMSLQAV